MIELAAILLILILVTAVGLFALRRLGKRTRSRGVMLSQALLVALASLPLVLGPVWKLTSSRTHQVFGEIVPRVDTQDRVVALTFDDGPTPEFTPRVLAILRREGVAATFFVTGSELEGNPGLGRQIVDAGHELGNHSYSHPRMIGRSYAFVKDEVERTDALIRAAGHHRPIHFRAPYSKKFLVLPYYLGRTGKTLISCDLEPDSYPEVTAEASRIVKHVRDGVRPGSIILLHVMYPSRRTSLEAVPGILRELREDGYRFVTVSELLGKRLR
jgi:peptidoglycan-N-acetylglucosamine deacetylase